MKAHSMALAITEHESAYVVFEGQKLISWEVCPFTSGTGSALKHITAQIVRCSAEFKISSAVLEESALERTALPKLYAAAKQALVGLALPIFEIRTEDIFSSFGIPPPKTRDELRMMVSSIFPQVPGGHLMQVAFDAAALGLYFETNRLLSIN